MARSVNKGSSDRTGFVCPETFREEKHLHHLGVETPTSFENLTIFPLIGGGSTSERDYLLLDEAIELKQLVVEEISEGGSVPELKVTNSSRLPVLILDGEELVGAKQNRILNLTVLVAAHSTTTIPVSCVEAGRWSYRSPHFQPSFRVQYPSARAAKSAQVNFALRTHRRARSDQSAIWDDIAEKARRLASPSPTDAMAAIYETHTGRLERYLEAFSVLEGQVGVIFAIRGRICGLEHFDHPQTFAKNWPKLLRGYALDAIDTLEPASGEPPSIEAAREFLSVVERAERFETKAVGLGTDVRLDSAAVVGGALVALGRCLHRYAFTRPEEERRPHLRCPLRRRA
jgi:hypothetical protein